MAELHGASITGALRFLTFRVADRLYALAADQVSEVIRTPAVARVPLAPQALLGLANLRGSVLPVATARGLLSKPEREARDSDRTIVLGGAAPAGLAVDAIEGLVSVAAERIETAPAGLAAIEGEQLSGAFQQAGRDVAGILDIRRMLEGAFVARTRGDRRGRGAGAANETADTRAEGARLVTFEVGGQEYALPLESVREIISAPGQVTGAPGAEALLLGVVGYRDGLLPLLSLRGLLGFGAGPGRSDKAKVLVTHIGGALVGLVADQARAVLLAPAALVEAAPAMLAARTGGEAKVDAIYRADGGRRLVSILAPARLFREDVMARLGEAGSAAEGPGAADASGAQQRQFLVFRLGPDEFGLPIEAVDEVARAPERVARVPKTPKFLEGVINLRGEVLPVVDQRRRFDMPPADHPQARRLIVLRTDRHRAGVIVDSVSEVLRCAALDIEVAPEVAGEANRLVSGVLNLEASGRLVMLLDPAELLTRVERGLLDAFTPEAGKADA
jgi:purine-binding chemotaxis protein CheW